MANETNSTIDMNNISESMKIGLVFSMEMILIGHSVVLNVVFLLSTNVKKSNNKNL